MQQGNDAPLLHSIVQLHALLVLGPDSPNAREQCDEDQYDGVNIVLYICCVCQLHILHRKDTLVDVRVCAASCLNMSLCTED